MDTEKEELLFAMARHIRNVDGVHPSTWGVQGGQLLMRLRTIDGEKYDRFVLKKGPGSRPDDSGLPESEGQDKCI